jgi:DNA replication protein DnaC
VDETTFISKKIQQLKMPGMLDTFQQRLDAASIEKWSYSTFLDMLLSDELDRRNHKQLQRRLAKSFLPPDKTLESFDFSFNPKIPAPLIRELATCKFVTEGQNIFLLGPSGTGKSHIAEALGHEACRKGFDVLFYRCHKLFDWIHNGYGDGSHKRRLEHVIKVPLLILDDFGLQTLPEGHQEDLYEVICRRYETKAMIITSNRDMSEWAGVFGNALIATAALDRLVHKGIEISLEGNSYRLDQYQKRVKQKPKK